MSIDKVYRHNERGSAVVIVLIALVVVAVGVLAYMSGKMGDVSKLTGGTNVASTDMPVGEGAPAGDNPVIARVNGEEIKRSDVIELVNVMPPQMQQIPLEQLVPIAVEQLINNKIIDEKSANANLDSDPDVQKQLASAKEQIIRSKFVENAVTKEMSEEKLKAKYEEYLKGFPDVEEVKAAHILVDDESKAKDLIKELEAGKAFADLAKANSKDGTAKTGGELGYFTKQDVVKPFAEAAFATKVGEYTKKPVKSEFGYHIIRVDEKRKRPPATYEQAKPFIEQEVRRAVLDEVVKTWREAAKIERFDMEGKPLPPQGSAPAAAAQEPSAGEAAPEAPASAPAAAPAEAPAQPTAQ